MGDYSPSPGEGIPDYTGIEDSIIRMGSGFGNFGVSDAGGEGAIIARAVCSVLGKLEGIDQIIMTMEVRRDRACKETERRHDERAARLRPGAKEIQDVEFRTIEQDADTVLNTETGPA
jgi:hypothetical protein